MKAVTDTKYYDEIARRLIENGSYSDSLTPAEMADAVEEIAMQKYSDGLADGEYAGKLFAQDEFWDKAQQNGNRTNYERAFAGVFWTNELLKPKWDIKPKWGGATSLFQGSPFEGNLREHLESLNVTLDVSGLTNSNQMFYGAEKITEIPFLDLSGCTNVLGNLFYGCKALITAHIKLSKAVPINTNCFTNCIALKNLTVEGTIGVSGFDVHWSAKLSRSSILSIMQACNKDSAGATITLPAKCIDGNTVTETYIANDTEMSTVLAEATDKGYTILFN